MQPWVNSKPASTPKPKMKMPKANNGSPKPVKLPKSATSDNVTKSRK